MSLWKTLYPLLSTGSTLEDRKSSQYDWKIVDGDSKQTKNENITLFVVFLPKGNDKIHMFVVWPAKHGRHIGIMNPSSVLASSVRHTFGFRSITFKGTFEGVYQFYSKLTKG